MKHEREHQPSEAAGGRPRAEAIIIGAGPAGLTAALELLRRTGVKPIVYEMSSDIGGISKTVVYRGNRIDIGGHRFFSKSRRVMPGVRSMPSTGAPSSSPERAKASGHS